MDADAVARWTQVITLIAAIFTTVTTFARFIGEDRLVKRQMNRLDELEKISSSAPDDLVDYIRSLQREVVSDYLATAISRSWNRIGAAKLPMAGLATAVAMFALLTGTLIASPVVGIGLRHTSFLIPFSLAVGVPVAGLMGWLAMGPVMGRRMLREELQRRFTRHATLEGAEERIELPQRLRRGGNIVGAIGAITMFLGVTAGTVATWSLIAGVTQSVLTTASVVMMLIAVSLALAIMIVMAKGPEKYGELALKRRHPSPSTR